MKVTFTIPGQPVPKARARVTKNGNFTPRRVRQYENKCRDYAAQYMMRDRLAPAEDDVFVSIELYLKDKRHGDIDNYAKAITDSMNKVVYKDDKQVKSLHVLRHYDKERPRAHVIVGLYNDAMQQLSRALDKAMFGGSTSLFTEDHDAT